LCRIVCEGTKESSLLPLRPDVSFSDFHNKVRGEFELVPSDPSSLVYYYFDNEGDRCTVSNTGSLEDALLLCRDDNLAGCIMFDVKSPRSDGVSSWRGNKEEKEEESKKLIKKTDKFVTFDRRIDFCD